MGEGVALGQGSRWGRGMWRVCVGVRCVWEMGLGVLGAGRGEVPGSGATRSRPAGLRLP